jgi:pyrophosphatase PpaX
MRAILFDMDGVLIDSKEAWFYAFRSQRRELTREEFEREWWSRDQNENLKKIGMGSARFCDGVLADYLDRVVKVEGVEEVLDGIELPKAIITNTTRRCTEVLLDRFDLGRRFDVVVASDDVEHAKPDSDPVRMACDALGVDPGDAAMVGDSEKDVEAGRRAGCVTIGFGIEGDYRVDDIQELPALVRRLSDRRNGGGSEGGLHG